MSVSTNMKATMDRDFSAIRVALYDAQLGSQWQFRGAFVRKLAYLFAGALLASLLGVRVRAQTCSEWVSGFNFNSVVYPATAGDPGTACSDLNGLSVPNPSATAGAYLTSGVVWNGLVGNPAACSYVTLSGTFTYPSGQTLPREALHRRMRERKIK
jgi:hypothetical protein